MLKNSHIQKLRENPELNSLIQAMTHIDPKQRPSIQNVLERLNIITQRLLLK